MENLEYTADDVRDAMALWEAFLDTDQPKFEAFKENEGTCACRDAIQAISKKCSRLHKMAVSYGFDDSYDWEWCPWFLRNCVKANLTVRERAAIVVMLQFSN